MSDEPRKFVRKVVPIYEVPEHVERMAKAICDASGGAWRTGTYPVHSGPNFEVEDHCADVLNNQWRYIAEEAYEALQRGDA